MNTYEVSKQAYNKLVPMYRGLLFHRIEKTWSGMKYFIKPFARLDDAVKKEGGVKL